MKKKCTLILITVLTLVMVFNLTLAIYAAEPLVVIGDSMQPLSNPVNAAELNFKQWVAQALGIELITTNDDFREEKQVQDVESLVARGVQGVLVICLTTSIGPKIVQICEDANIPLANHNRGVAVDINDSKILVSQVLQDDFGAGYECMKQLLDSGARNIIMINGPKGVWACEERYRGLMKAIAEVPDAKLIGEQWIQQVPEIAVETMENYLTKFGSGEIDGVWSGFSVAGMGALAAIKKTNRLDEIKIVTHDLMADVIDAIGRGEIYFGIGEHQSVGGFALIQLYDYIKGYPMEPKRVIIQPMIGVTTENIGDWEKYWKDNKPFTLEQIRQLSKVYNPNAKLVETVENLKIVPVIAQ